MLEQGHPGRVLGTGLDLVRVPDPVDHPRALLNGELDVGAVGPVDLLHQAADVVEGDGVEAEAGARLGRVADPVDGAGVDLVAAALLGAVVAGELGLAERVLGVLERKGG